VDDGANETDVVDLLHDRGATARAGVPRQHPLQPSGSIRIDDDEVLAVGDAVHARVALLILRIPAAAVEVDDDRRRLRTGARRDVNDVGALAEVDAVVARREDGEEEERTQHGQRRAARNSSAWYVMIRSAPARLI